MADLVPSTLILRLFLAPNDFRGVRVACDYGGILFSGERIDLFEPRKCDVLLTRSPTRLEQIEIDLTACDHETTDLRRIDGIDFINHVAK